MEVLLKALLQRGRGDEARGHHALYGVLWLIVEGHALCHICEHRLCLACYKKHLTLCVLCADNVVGYAGFPL